MTIEFHPAVQTDFNQALDYYQAQGGRISRIVLKENFGRAWLRFK